DGFAVAGAWAPEAWPRFCTAIGRDDLVDDPRFHDNPSRVANREELNGILRPIFATRSTAEWEERFRAANALFGEVCTFSRILNPPRTAGLVQHVRHSTLGDIPQLASPISMSATPPSMRRPPPVLGEHTVEILAELGYSPDAIDGMVRNATVQCAPGAVSD